MVRFEVNKKDEFKRRFREFDTEELIENALNPLTDEAYEATEELLAERGLVGEGLQLKVSAIRKEIVTRPGHADRCDYCGKSIGFSSVRSARQRFCSEKCRSDSALLVKSIDLAPDLIAEHANRMKFGACPLCGVTGNYVEMWPSHHVFSALVITRYSRKCELSCITCARKARLRAAASCLVLGWWSIAGFFSTPVLIFRNLRAAYSEPDDSDPSDELLLRSRLELARLMPEFSLQRESGQGDLNDVVQTGSG